MRASGKRVGRVLTPVLLVCLLMLTCTVYAAPATTQKSAQQTRPAAVVDVNCPIGTQINLTGTAPAGWTVFPIYNGYLKLSSVTVRNPGDPGMGSATRGQLDCFYSYGAGGTAVPFTQMFTPLPEGQTCTVAATGARCFSK
jgi:hypothetical protein